MAGLTWFEIKESCDFGSSVFGKQEGTKMLLFVMGQKKIDGHEYLFAEPIDSETGCSTDFEGEMFAVDRERTTSLGKGSILLTRLKRPEIFGTKPQAQLPA